MIELLHIDCMEYMAGLPDKAFDLAIVDPPYGIGVDGAIRIEKPDRPSTWTGIEKYEQKAWDATPPSANYFAEVRRVSADQIVWGGNYFADLLPASKGWIFWDKQFENTFNFSHGELAWTSFGKQLLKFTLSSKAETRGGKDRIHPTQKPVALYRWLLQNYAKPGQRILDTHLGSGSIAIACDIEGFDLVGCEIDADYIAAARKRLADHQAQPRMFEAPKEHPKQLEIDQ